MWLEGGRATAKSYRTWTIRNFGRLEHALYTARGVFPCDDEYSNSLRLSREMLWRYLSESHDHCDNNPGRVNDVGASL